MQVSRRVHGACMAVDSFVPALQPRLLARCTHSFIPSSRRPSSLPCSLVPPLSLFYSHPLFLPTRSESDYPYSSGNGVTGKCKKTCTGVVTISKGVEVPKVRHSRQTWRHPLTCSARQDCAPGAYFGHSLRIHENPHHLASCTSLANSYPCPQHNETALATAIANQPISLSVDAR